MLEFKILLDKLEQKVVELKELEEEIRNKVTTQVTSGGGGLGDLKVEKKLVGSTDNGRPPFYLHKRIN